MRICFLCLFVFILLATSVMVEANTPKFFTIHLDNFYKQYPIVPAPGNKEIQIVYLYDLLDNYGLATSIARQLSSELHKHDVIKNIDVLVIPGDKANMIGTLLFDQLIKINPGIKMCIIRSTDKGGSFKSVEYKPITSKISKILHLREDQYATIYGKNVLIFDDVISSGATMSALSQLVSQAHGKIIAYSCFATEEEERSHFNLKPLYSLVHLPVFIQKNTEIDKALH